MLITNITYKWAIVYRRNITQWIVIEWVLSQVPSKVSLQPIIILSVVWAVLLMLDMMTYPVCSDRAPKSVFWVRNQLEQINNKSCRGLDGLNGYSEVGNSLADVLNYVFGPHTSLSRWCEWNNKRVSSNLMINGSLLYKYTCHTWTEGLGQEK